MRKRLFCMALLLVLCISAIALPVGAEEVNAPENTVKEKAVEIKNTTVTDSLPQKEAERWYRFTLENTADAVIRLTSDFAEEGDYWYILVYKEGKPYSLTADGLGSTTLRAGTATLSSLEPGIYYIYLRSYAEGPPGTSDKYYTSTPYNLEVITEGYTHPTGSAQRKTVSKAGEIIAVIGGKVYLKRNDGEAYVANFVNQGGYRGVESCPILLSEDADAVEYYTPTVTDAMINCKKVELNGKTYYYSNARDGYEGVARDATLYQCCEGRGVTNEEAANDLLKLHFGVSPLEEEQKAAEEKDKKGTMWAIVVIVAIFVFGIVELVLILRHSKRGKSYGSSGYITDTDTVPTDRDIAGMVDDKIIEQITKNIHTPGYEADGPSTGPGPEDFPTGSPEDFPTESPEDFPSSGGIW